MVASGDQSLCDTGVRLAERGQQMSKKTEVVGLFVEGNHIVDHLKNPVSIDEARRLWNAAKVSEYNMAFMRLATRANWDFNELDRQLAEMDKNRGK